MNKESDTTANKVVVKNILDKGSYLRREMGWIYAYTARTSFMNDILLRVIKNINAIIIIVRNIRFFLSMSFHKLYGNASNAIEAKVQCAEYRNPAPP